MKRILIVEDDINIQELHRATLGDQYAVTLTGSVDEALDALNDRVFDIVITDLRLRGGRSGTDLADVIRESPGLRHLKLIACTAYRLAANEVSSPGERFDAIVEKPFLPEALRAAVDRVARLSRRD
jgi:CheY-like chemotaxis protein